MLNIFWVFVPFTGWFALGGYGVRIIQQFLKGDFKELPKFDFTPDLKLGFSMFLKALPFIFSYIILLAVLWAIDPRLHWLRLITEIFVIPFMSIHFVNKMTVASFFEFGVLKHVLNDLGGYLMALLKEILLGILFFILSFGLIGFPMSTFTKNIFLADFYRRSMK